VPVCSGLGGSVFNAGSALSAGPLAGSAFIATNTAAAAGMLSWMLIEYLRFGKATMLGAASGIVAGLVAITPGGGIRQHPRCYGDRLRHLHCVVHGDLLPQAAASATMMRSMCLACTGSQAFGVHSLLGSSRVPLSMRPGTGLAYGHPAQLEIQGHSGGCNVCVLLRGPR